MRPSSKAKIFIGCLLGPLLHFFVATAESETYNQTAFDYLDKGDRGPSSWGSLKPEWSACGNGKLQSPVDLSNRGAKSIREPGNWIRNQKPAPALLHNRGHDIMMNWTGDAAKLNVNGTEFKLSQIHWHTPSEHTINGTRYDMELHMVHESQKGKVAVIAFLYKYGPEDSFLSEFLHHVTPSETGKGISLGSMSPGNFSLEKSQFFRYTGSLTTPPCTEGVIWTVMTTVISASREQAAALRGAVHDGYERNARPVQALNGRPVSLFVPS